MHDKAKMRVVLDVEKKTVGIIEASNGNYKQLVFRDSKIETLRTVAEALMEIVNFVDKSLNSTENRDSATLDMSDARNVPVNIEK